MQTRTWATWAAATTIIFAACSGGDADTQAGGAADSTAAGTAAVPADSLSITGFSTPESVLHDAAADVYFVSNINGAPLAMDDNGFISRVAPDGSVQALKFIDGAAENVTLNGPKGLAIIGDTLFVSDIDNVRAFDRNTGAPLGARPVRGATFLNDLAVGPDSKLYVTDSGLKADFSTSGTDAVYRFDGANAVAVAKGTDKLHGPNGLAVTADGIFVVPFGGKSLYRIAPDGAVTEVMQLPTGGLDGIVRTGAGWLVTSWDGKTIYQLDAQNAATPSVTGIDGPADIGYDAKRGRLLIPVFNGNAVEIRKR